MALEARNQYLFTQCEDLSMCWHKYDRWTPPIKCIMGWIFSDREFVVMMQFRKCKKCGKTQSRRVE